MRNARQILDIVVASFGEEILDPSSDADESKADYHELAHGWRELVDSYNNNPNSPNLIPSITKVSPSPLSPPP